MLPLVMYLLFLNFRKKEKKYAANRVLNRRPVFYDFFLLKTSDNFFKACNIETILLSLYIVLK